MDKILSLKVNKIFNLRIKKITQKSTRKTSAPVHRARLCSAWRINAFYTRLRAYCLFQHDAAFCQRWSLGSLFRHAYYVDWRFHPFKGNFRNFTIFLNWIKFLIYFNWFLNQIGLSQRQEKVQNLRYSNI